ncbi:MAG: Trk family potassium uptake protein [Clostridia bacterium]|nr:Trk family potassium uptake protein [Clostridia bacterium]
MKMRRLSHAQIIALGFLLVIALGTLLLMLPAASRNGESAGFLTALFTATSASCVTGLVVVDTATNWSLFGQIVILIMIQTGGLGFMTIATLFFFLVRKKISIRERAVLAESISSAHIGRILSLTGMIFAGTLIFELLGAALLSIRFIPQFGAARGIYYAVFHSVSAFCNAGFDLMGIREPFSSFTAYSGDALVNITLMVLITVGGIGFLVWDDILQKGIHWKKYYLHTKLVLSFSAALTIGGAFCFFLLEKNRLNAGMPLGEQVLVSLFSSVTPRTAGFNTVDTASLSSGSKLLTTILMFIGGSSGSTAGGIKTTTLAVILLSLSAGFRKQRCAYAFGRRLPDEALKRASIIVFTSLILALGGALLISGIQGLDISDTLFEVFSAIGTVGLSTGVTRSLSVLSRCVIIILMYSGRVGSVSFAIALLERHASPPITYPEEQITVG